MNGHAIDLEYEINSPAEIRQFQHRWERDMFPDRPSLSGPGGMLV